MSKAFEKLLKQGIKSQCELIQLENESSGFTIYIISNDSGFAADLSEKELTEIVRFVNTVKKTKGVFSYNIDNMEYRLRVRYRSDFGEQVFSLKILAN